MLLAGNTARFRVHRHGWARLRTAVACVAAVGVALMCLSYRDLEPNHSAPSLKNGDYFASMAPSEDDLDSPDGRRGFVLLQKVAASSLLHHLGTNAAARSTPGGAKLVELAGRASGLGPDDEVDYLSAGAARSQLKDYWRRLAHQTMLENGGGVQVNSASSDAEEVHVAHSPLTADEARRQLQDFWSSLGKHDRVKSIRDQAKQKVESAARLRKKAVDPVKDTTMDEMERIWSSESAHSKGTHAAGHDTAKKAGRVPETKLHHFTANESASARSAPATAEGSKGSSGPSSSLLPTCSSCSLQESLVSWPVWNHRVDHALRVAENIAQGSPWNKTLHDVTLGPDAAEADAADKHDEDGGKAAAGYSDKDMQLEVESAVSSLRAAIAESKAEQVEQEAQDHGEGASSLASSQRTHCLRTCFVELQSLVTRHGFAVSRADAPAPLASTPKQKEAAATRQAASDAPEARKTSEASSPQAFPNRKTALAKTSTAKASSHSGDDSIENVVDSVEEAMGDSEEKAAKLGGSGVAAAVKAVAHVVADDVADTSGDHVQVHSATAKAQGRSPSSSASWSSSRVPAASSAGTQVAEGTSVSVSASHRAKAAGSAAGGDDADGDDVRRLEDSALNDAAQAQEQVREGESELKRLKTLLKRARSIKHEDNSSEGDTSSEDDSTDDSDASAEDGTDESDSVEGGLSGLGSDSGLASVTREALAVKDGKVPRSRASA
jgi:hypothetical protein